MIILIQPTSHREQGGAVIVVLALLAIMLIFVNANLRALSGLGRELKLVEQKQIKRLNARTNLTKAVPAQFSSASFNATPGGRRSTSQISPQ